MGTTNLETYIEASWNCAWYEDIADLCVEAFISTPWKTSEGCKDSLTIGVPFHMYQTGRERELTWCLDGYNVAETDGAVYVKNENGEEIVGYN